MRTLVLCVLMLAACKRSTSNEVETRLTTALKAEVPGVVIERGEPGTLNVKRGAATVMEISLEPLIRTCDQKKDECDSIIANSVAVVKKSVASYASDEKKGPPDKTLIRLTPKPGVAAVGRRDDESQAGEERREPVGASALRR